MKNKILAIVKELEFASLDEIALIFSKLKSIHEKTLKSNIQELMEERALLKILPNENSLSCEGFISGPNSAVEEDFEIKKLIADELPTRDLPVISWELVSQRISTELLEEIEQLKENILKKHDTKRKLEMYYFNLSLKYHELYRFFYGKKDIKLLIPAQEKLGECKLYLNKLEL